MRPSEWRAAFTGDYAVDHRLELAKSEEHGIGVLESKQRGARAQRRVVRDSNPARDLVSQKADPRKGKSPMISMRALGIRLSYKGRMVNA